MTEFLQLVPPQEALKVLLNNIDLQVQSEEISSAQALGRVTAESIHAPHPLPSFKRSTVDGFAVRAQDTYGASENLPAYLHLAGEVPMGGEPNFQIPPRACALIHTGGMIPEQTDAVVMVEYTQMLSSDEVEILRPVASGENVIQIGEDVAIGEKVISSGVIIRPAEIGGLAALGIQKIRVARQPRVGILSTGDEVVPPYEEPKPGQVRDVNTNSLAALIQSVGGIYFSYGILPDQEEMLFEIATRALQENDMVVITAGSSASTRDLTARIVNRVGKPGVLVHGVNIRPGKPTILAACTSSTGKRKAFIGLPGNPVSALVIAGLFVVPVIHSLLGISDTELSPRLHARLMTNLPSQAGREDWVPVHLKSTPTGFQAEPIFGKSNLIFTLVRANGMVRIPSDATGLAAGEIVEVYFS